MQPANQCPLPATKHDTSKIPLECFVAGKHVMYCQGKMKKVVVALDAGGN